MRRSRFRFVWVSVFLAMFLAVMVTPALAYTVKKGDTLWDLVGTRYPEVARANHISNPDLIYAGQNLDLRGLAPSSTPTRPHPSTSTPHPSTSTPSTSARPRPHPSSAPATGGDNVSGGVWDKIAECESSGNWHNRDTGHNGHYGGLQFSLSSWRAVGGTGNPADASKAEQIMRANKLLALQGWGAWSCAGARFGR